LAKGGLNPQMKLVAPFNETWCLTEEAVMKQKQMITSSILLYGLLLVLTFSVRANQHIELSNSPPDKAIHDFNEWTKKFLNLSKNEALSALKDFNAKVVNYKSKNGNANIKISAELPNGYMKLFMHPQKQKVRSVAFTLKETFTSSTKSIIDIKDTIVSSSVSNLNFWSQKFIGHSKKDAMRELRNFNPKEIYLKNAKDPLRSQYIWVKLPLRGNLRVFVDPHTNLVIASDYHILGLNHLPKEKR